MALKTTLEEALLPLPWQIPAWQELATRLANDSLPHALLISGVPGIGKLHFARAFAALALCRNPQNTRACGRCNACRQFISGSHPDFHIVTIVEDKSGILIDQIRELSQALSLTSLHSGWKIAVLAPADSMNANAANGLLKTLEEPTSRTLLILITSRPAVLPATIRSRCQSIRMRAPATGTAIEWLNAQTPRMDWQSILKIAGGGPLLTLELAASHLMQDRLQFYSLLMEMREGKRNPIRCAADFRSEELPVILRLLQAWTADLITLAIAGKPGNHTIINSDALPMLQNALNGINLRGLYAFLDEIQESIALLATPLNKQLMLEGLFMEWAQGLKTLNTTPLAARGG